jgi:uncharacterized OB-fold protein/acyl dehydratase
MTMALHDELQSLVGSSSGEPVVGLDAVNAPMIRHMVVALGDANPVYVDEEAARAAGHPGIVAPPTMLQTWQMAGLGGHGASRQGGWGKALELLDAAGFSSTVAVNCEQEYVRYLTIGDRVTVTGFLDSISEEKQTGLGIGHFVTTRDEYRDQDGELVGTHMFRVLKFKPGTGKGAAAPEQDRPLRPRPPTTRDTQWWFDALQAGKLLIQRCTSCGTLRHPPGPACAECHSSDWDTVEATGRGTVYSFVVVEHPQAPAFDYPLPVVLVELEEGTRLVSNLLDVPADEVEIGMPVVVEIVTFDDELTIPQFRKA